MISNKVSPEVLREPLGGRVISGGVVADEVADLGSHVVNNKLGHSGVLEAGEGTASISRAEGGRTALKPLDVEELSFLPRSYSKYFQIPGSPVLVGRRGVHGDGSCFFHAVCVALNTQNYLHVSQAKQKHIGHVFRCNFNNHVTKRRWQTFLKRHDVSTKVTFKELRQNFCTNHFWADEMMIKLVSDVLRLDLIFINGNTGEIHCGVHGKKKDPMIVILWIKESHFEPVFCIRDTGGSVKVQFMFLWETDRDIISSVLNNYRSQCKVAVD
jgi:hypothetical protein